MRAFVLMWKAGAGAREKRRNYLKSGVLVKKRARKKCGVIYKCARGFHCEAYMRTRTMARNSNSNGRRERTPPWLLLLLCAHGANPNYGRPLVLFVEENRLPARASVSFHSVSGCTASDIFVCACTCACARIVGAI